MPAIHEFYERMLLEIAGRGGYEDRVIVTGEGNSDSPAVVFVGEAPGAEEERLGRPFVGTAGRNLDGMLAELGRARTDIFITNLVKVRPVRTNPKTGRRCNRPPTRDETAFFAPYLFLELSMLAPKCVVTLGNHALAALTNNRNAVIGEMHGRLTRAGSLNLFPMYHPAAVIYNRRLRGVMEQDVLKLRHVLEELYEQ